MPNRHHHDIVVIGGADGAPEALFRFLPELPTDLDAAIFIVMHTRVDAPDNLPQLLSNRCSYPTAHAIDGEPIQPRHIYVAPPDRHLLLNKGHITLAMGPRENGFRPAVDPLFRSAAFNFGSRVLGLILSGPLDDGTAGLVSIKLHGGLAIAQDPSDALYPEMPSSAVVNVELDHIAPAAKLASRVAESVRLPAGTKGPAMENKKNLTPSTAPPQDADGFPDLAPPAPPRNFVCPDCGGAMWELTSDHQLRFRCHTGHLHTGDTLASGQKHKIEEALWSAIRSLQESESLRRQMAERQARSNQSARAGESLRKADAVREQINILTSLVRGGGAPIRAAGRETA